MTDVLIYGAGSIGNHLAHGCRQKGWGVTMTDLDTAALARTRDDIYPSRYGAWDEGIQLAESVDPASGPFDLVIVGTPPDTHIDIALDVLAAAPPRALLLEKPVCTPGLENCNALMDRLDETGAIGLVGYNHTLTPNTVRAREILPGIGRLLSLHCQFREHWGGIFNAHPWLDGPADTYLGYSSRGGGAGGEHSHAANLWLHFSHLLGMGRITEVSAMLDLRQEGGAEYDRAFHLGVRTEGGLVGTITQDVVTDPPSKMLRLQGEDGFLEWHANFTPDADAIIYRIDGGEVQTERFPKSRPDDFKPEIEEIERILEGGDTETPISILRGMETMLVVRAGFESHDAGRRARIDYDAGLSSSAISFA